MSVHLLFDAAVAAASILHPCNPLRTRKIVVAVGASSQHEFASSAWPRLSHLA